MKAVIKIYREVEIPKEYEHLFKSSPCPKWKKVDWDKVDLDWDSFSFFCKEIRKTLNSTDDWEFVDF